MILNQEHISDILLTLKDMNKLHKEETFNRKLLFYKDMVIFLTQTSTKSSNVSWKKFDFMKFDDLIQISDDELFIKKLNLFATSPKVEISIEGGKVMKIASEYLSLHVVLDDITTKSGNGITIKEEVLAKLAKYEGLFEGKYDIIVSNIKIKEESLMNRIRPLLENDVVEISFKENKIKFFDQNMKKMMDVVIEFEGEYDDIVTTSKVLRTINTKYFNLIKYNEKDIILYVSNNLNTVKGLKKK